MVEDAKQEFWNSRAGFGGTAGSNDFILKKLELDLILQQIPAGSSVLDVGCGNGETLMTLAREKGCTGTGIDFAQEMIKLARATNASSATDRAVDFRVGRLPGLPKDIGKFDYALSERCLINLDNRDAQHEAFKEIMSFVNVGGCYLMIESSIQGLERTNQLRRILDLEPIAPPWHNVFIDEDFVLQWSSAEFQLEEVVPFESTYHLLSRVIYAKLAKDKGEELRYDSDINMLALKLPSIGNLGPVKLWKWRKT